ncbi:aldo/keto reductase [Plantibacter sp. ME-Dv--P-122b]|uniref:aldo/keto reductase n=1 Tax=Plantibacter sp. ME-Dv--P-122b TaxID=3040300 RepID=UPI00254B158D|nr:aldo/keto reductase [Plantibacter sp. ME-Dv--P-122b]
MTDRISTLVEPRPLGDTGLTVSPIIAGAAGWRRREDGSGSSPEESLELAASMASDGVVTTIDTANNYGFGDSERRVAWALGQLGQSAGRLSVQTKADREPGTDDFSAPQMRRSLEQSMERLGVDRLPMVYLHDPENTTWERAMAHDGPVAALVAARDEGLIGGLGISGGPAELLSRFVDTGWFQALITHNRFTLVDRSSDALLTQAAAAGLGVLNAAPYGGGLLTSWPVRTTRYAYSTAPASMLEAVDRIGRLCDEAGVPLAAAALQWSLRDPRITGTIVGMERLEDYTRTLDLAALPIDDALWAAIEAVELDRSTWQDAARR